MGTREDAIEFGRNHVGRPGYEGGRDLEAELDVAERLQQVSTRLIQADDVHELFEQILDTAVAIMRSDYASIQMLDREQRELRLLVHRVFTREAAKSWERLRPVLGTICGEALRTGQRCIVADVERCDLIAGSDGLKTFLQTGIRAVQSTPLVSRSGTLIGMISTHWREPHEPGASELRMLDVLARQAADLIERAQSDKALRERERELADFFENSPVGLHWIGADGVILRANQAELDLLGTTRDEYIGRHIADFYADRGVGEDILRRFARGETLRSYAARKRCKDGSIKHVLIDGNVLWGKNGEFIHARCFTRDVTEQRRAEAALRSLNAELEERVAARTTELVSSIAERERLQEQLLQAQKLESIGTLAGGIAHDFNNLLNIIMGYTLLIQHCGYRGNVSEALEVIRETVQRAAALVQQLLAMARKSEVKFQQTDINEIVKTVGRVLAETFPKTIDIALNLDSDLPPLLADPNQIHQALLNLSINARDAMPHGGHLLLETSITSGDELRRRFRNAQPGRYVCIRVTDSGIGIDESTQGRIFEPFFTTKPQGQGTGLGLSVVYGIVTNHSGFVDVESAPGRGTRFSIYFPLAQERFTPELKAEPDVDARQEFRGCGETLLFVDDEERQLRLMREFLEKQGYRVLAARDGAEAVDVYSRHKQEIALVVLDLGLPKLNGWQAFQRMREIEPNVKALFATGLLSPEIEAEMRRVKVAGVLEKPYELGAVLEKITTAVRSPAARALS
ncbi:MAG TPA: ATP-binding protein [Candidatus Eisenbacteria bacterium]|nr:ATP-binding protein [Candidatus Eisenbacteria bacterium]